MACSKTNVVKVVSNFLLIVFFYASSISLTFYNKWMSKRYRFPLSVSTVHFVVVFLCAAVARKTWELYKREKRIVLEWDMYMRRIVPTAMAGSLDIGFSNWSIMLSTVSLYTMAKSSTILFVMFFSIMFHLEKPSWLLFLVVICIASGLFLFTFESKQFDMVGFSMAILAAVMGGIRWATAQLVMQKSEIGLSNPVDAIYHIQPVMAAVMIFLAIGLEGKEVASSPLLFRAPTLSIGLTSLVIVLIGAFLAFILTISEFLLVSHTSGIALSIAGIFKEVCTLTIAAEFGGDKWGPINFIGLVVCMIGISIYVVNKAMRETENNKASKEELVSMVTYMQDEDFETDTEELTLESSLDKSG